MNLQQALDRVAELEDAMGLTAKLPRDLIPRELAHSITSSSPATLRFIGMLLAREIISREAMFLAMYGGRIDSDEPQQGIADVYVWKARKVLATHGVEIKNRRGEGWYLDAANKAKLRAVIAQLNAQREAA